MLVLCGAVISTIYFVTRPGLDSEIGLGLLFSAVTVACCGSFLGICSAVRGLVVDERPRWLSIAGTVLNGLLALAGVCFCAFWMTS